MTGAAWLLQPGRTVEAAAALASGDGTRRQLQFNSTIIAVRPPLVPNTQSIIAVNSVALVEYLLTSVHPQFNCDCLQFSIEIRGFFSPKLYDVFEKSVRD